MYFTGHIIKRMDLYSQKIPSTCELPCRSLDVQQFTKDLCVIPNLFQNLIVISDVEP